ncbi:Ubiquitin carboxyl-terminal hydrolase 10 [Lecanora helva]
MVKRQAEEPLEQAVGEDSPAQKKSRLDAISGASKRTNGFGAGSSQRASVNGGGKYHEQSLGRDILGAADEEKEELEEATSPPDVEAEDEQSAYSATLRQSAPIEGFSDLYLDTIDRSVLDFDFEKLCSITLSNINVYACLVCGRYYQGRGPKSHAYYHALEVGHHVYVNMQTKKVYVLPEGYEVKSKSLDDIKFVVDPRLSKEEVLRLDKEAKDAWDLGGRKYRPGFVGMNNIKENDYFNVIIQALSHIPPLRNFLMLEDFSERPEIVQRFSVLVRKMWNTRAFKIHVSPHELLQQVSRQSSKRFDLLNQSDPADFMSWLLNNMHLALGGSKTKPGTSIIQRVFQGKLKIESQQITAKADVGDRLRFEEAGEVLVDVTRYLMLTLDLPAAPLFQDELEKNIIPQVPLTSILSKYDGRNPQEHMNTRKRYRLLHPLPPFLLFHIKRFSKNKFVTEHNPTIVTFPTRSLDMSPYVEPNPAVSPIGEPIWYDLVANVTHEAVRTRDDSVEGEAEKKVWRVQVRDRARDEWLEIQDLYVQRVVSETLFTKESYLMVWEKRKDLKGKSRS